MGKARSGPRGSRFRSAVGGVLVCISPVKVFPLPSDYSHSEITDVLQKGLVTLRTAQRNGQTLLSLAFMSPESRAVSLQPVLPSMQSPQRPDPHP